MLKKHFTFCNFLEKNEEKIFVYFNVRENEHKKIGHVKQ